MLHIKSKGMINAATWLQIFNLQTPPPHPPWGSKGQNSTFSEHGHAAYQIISNHQCSIVTVANILPADPPLPNLRVKRSKEGFLKVPCHVLYQIKRNHEFSNMVANILLADPANP